VTWTLLQVTILLVRITIQLFEFPNLTTSIEVNIAENAEAHAKGQHPGWEETAWDGIQQSIEILNKKRIRVIVNGGAHNPKGLAEKIQQLVQYAFSFLSRLTNIIIGPEEGSESQSGVCTRR